MLADSEFIKIYSNPLPANLIKSLLEISECAGMIRGILQQDIFNELFNKILFIEELFIANAIAGNDYTFQEIICRITSKDINNEIKAQYEIIEKCNLFAVEKAKQYGILPATDFLRINECIKSRDIKHLSDPGLFGQANSESKIIYELFGYVYKNYDRAYPFLNVAIIYLLLRTYKSRYFAEATALNILFGILINPNEKLPPINMYLSKLHLLEPVVIGVVETADIEAQITAFLNYLIKDFESRMVLMKRLLSMIDTIKQNFTKKLPKIYSDELFNTLTESLSFRYPELIERLGITYKTAVNYSKLLESNGFIISAKDGRDKIFINKYLLSLIQEGVGLDGA